MNVLRSLILLLFVLLLTFLALPFVMTSRALNENGVIIPGSVHHKSEYVRVVYSEWDLLRDITIEYTVPETSSVSFFEVRLDAQQYDSLHAKQAVEVRYLPRKDVPHVPGSGVLWELHALPTVRLASIQEVSRLHALWTSQTVRACGILASIIALLVLWRITRWRMLAWGAGIGVFPLIACILLQGFPRPTPAPAREVRHASGRVTNVGRIDNLFSHSRSRGVEADQPIDVVSVEFVPLGKTEPVVAVDLIDSGSIPGLKEKSTVILNYELASPRTAYIDGATRRFSERNLRGAIVTGLLCLAVAIIILGAAYLFDRGYNRLVSRSS